MAALVAGAFSVIACGGASSSDGLGGSALGGAANASSGGATNAAGTSASAGRSAGNAGTGGGGFCAGTGPVVTIPGSNGTTTTTCTGSIAETKFLNALCTCNNATVAGYLKTRGFDSRRGPSSSTNQGGGSVGINNNYAITTGYTDIGGSLTIAGPNSVSFAGFLEVGGNFSTASEATVAGYTKIHRDARFGGPFTDLGPATILGDLYTASSVIALPLQVGGKRVGQSVMVPKPCPCEPSDLLDVEALVRDARTHNDNASAGIDPKMFNLVVGNVHATLPCGRFYIERMSGIGNVIINVTGRVALFIDGPLDATGNIEFRLAPAGEIDIFVRDNLVLTGRAVFGNKDRPAATRIYVGGDGDVLLVGAGGFVGNVYAPRSLVTAVGYAEVWGSVFARDFVSPGYANFVYDRAIQNAGDTCKEPPPPPGTCSQCGSCTGGLACVNGTCGQCSTDADCCSPLVCTDGKCEEPIVIR
ncbi:MAG: DUF7305 domain-containing protein [Myxococcota bacterium]